MEDGLTIPIKEEFGIDELIERIERVPDLRGFPGKIIVSGRRELEREGGKAYAYYMLDGHNSKIADLIRVDGHVKFTERDIRGTYLLSHFLKEYAVNGY